jgi:hypothetical protein
VAGAAAGQAETRLPYWFPGAFEAQNRWTERMRSIAGPDGLAELLPDSLHYALLMRKYQAETFRREVPAGGYVMSVIRDIPNASMGLLDYRGQPKWTPADWAWQRDTISLLLTDKDRRSYAGGERLKARLLLSHFGPVPIRRAELTVALEPLNGSPLHQARRKGLVLPPGTLIDALPLGVPLPDVTQPTPLRLRAELRSPVGRFTNHWSFWIVPRAGQAASRPVRLHGSLNAELAAELFPAATPLDPAQSDGVIVASRFDDTLVRLLEQGGRVLLLPDGEPHSLPLAEHWFLRGAPYIPGHPLGRVVPRQLLVELQHFDLADRVIPDLQYVENLDPILLLWDTHDLRTVKTHGLLFESRAGQGRLLVSAVCHRGPANAAGAWLLDVLLDHLAAGPPPRQAFTDAQWTRLKQKLHEQKVPLTGRPWQFRPDPNAEGLRLGWHLPTLPLDAQWTHINVGQHWESQGFPALDRWAWYRLAVPIPADWPEVYLSFEGVDDLYELFIDGQLVAKRGDLATRQDTFNEKFSHRLTGLVRPGQTCLIAVRVHDWYGAGGIFRPVTLSTAPFLPAGDILK